MNAGWVCATVAIYKPDNTQLTTQSACGSEIYRYKRDVAELLGKSTNQS